MKRAFPLFASLVALAALVGFPAAAPAAEPEPLPTKLFDVVVGAGPVLEITFALTLSDVSTYPVTITAIAGAVEEPLWDGTLPEGMYRLRAPLKKITSGPVRVVLRTKMTNLQARRRTTDEEKEGSTTSKQAERGNQSFYSYRRWEGTISR